MLHGLCFGEEAGAPNLVFFHVKWLQPTMKGTSSVRRVRLRSFCARIVPPMCFATSRCVCVRSSMRFLNLWLQIALEWLLHCRHLMLPRPSIGSGLLRDAAKRIVVAVSRLLGAAAACVILLSIAAEDRKS